ncbi:MAG: hypothetical protein IKQ99_00285 [Alphaproteobacteria bacterium]|nr:hypothetical protein [Alphaproteobacteria bacterium]
MFASVPGSAGIDSFVNALYQADEAGLGKWQEVPFGKVRLVSCSDGVKDFSTVTGGMQIQLFPGWRLKKPILKPVTEKASFWSEAPLTVEEFYTGEVFIPLVYEQIVHDATDFDFGVQGGVFVCQEDNCMDLPLRLSLPLSADRGNYTTMCAYILQQQRNVPQPAKIFGVKGYAWESGEDETQLLFTGVKNADIVFLYPLKEEADVSEKRLESDAVFVRLKKNIRELPATLVLLTDRGSYRVPVETVKEPVHYSVFESVPAGLWLAGWELFFLTPLFIWWGLGVPKNSKIWKKQIIKLGLCFPLFFVLKMIFYYFGAGIISSQWYAYFSVFLLGTVCLFPPKKWYWALALFLIWPLSLQIPQTSWGTYIAWGIFMLIEAGIPFVFLYLKASELGKYLREMKKKKLFSLNFCFLLPAVLMLVFTLQKMYWPQISYSNEMNSDGLTVVCRLKECDQWKKVPGVVFVDPKTILGENLQKIYQREGRKLIIWRDQKGSMIFAPNVSVNRVLKFIEGRKNYRVLDKP